MLGCDGLIIAERNFYDDNRVAMNYDVRLHAGYEFDLSSGECVDLNGLIKRCWYIYHPSRYALASR